MTETIIKKGGSLVCSIPQPRVFGLGRWSAFKLFTAIMIGCMTLGATAQDSESGDRLKGYIKALTTYNDNVFQTPKGENDLLYTIYGGIDASIGTSVFEFGLLGEVMYHDYDEFDQQDDTAYELKPRIIIGTGENLLTLGLFGEFVEEYKPVDATTLEQVVNHFDTGRAELTIRPTDTFGLKLTGALTDAIYEDFGAGELDYSRVEYSGSLFKKCSDKTTVGIKYLWADMDYDEEIRYDGETERYTLYMDYFITGKTKTHIEGGYEVHTYDLTNGIIADTEDDEAEAWYVDVSIAYSPTAKFDVEVGVTRQINQGSSLSSNYYVETKPYIDIAFKPTSKLTAGVRSYFSQVIEHNSFDSNKTGVEAKLNYAIIAGFEIEAGHEYTERESDSPAGNFHRNVSTAGIVYRF